MDATTAAMTRESAPTPVATVTVTYGPSGEYRTEAWGVTVQYPGGAALRSVPAEGMADAYRIAELSAAALAEMGYDVTRLF